MPIMIPTAAPSPGDRGPWAVNPSRSKAGVRTSSVLRHRLPMRSSPYVGWFRHAPPSSSSSRRAPGTWGIGRPRSHSFTSSGSALGRYQALHRSSGATPPVPAVAAPASFRPFHAHSSLGRMKSSPYVGWFRHAPPSRVRVQGSNFGNDRAFAEAVEAVVRMSSKTVHNSNGSAKAEDIDAETFLKALPISKVVEMARGRHRYYVDGRLRGGCPLHEEDGGRGEGVFPFDDEDGPSGATALFDRHRIFESIHQSTSTHGLHFNAFAQDDGENQDDDEQLSSSSALEKSSSGVLSSIGDERSVQEDNDGDRDLPGSPSATIGVLNRLAHWLVPPMARNDTLSHYEDFAMSSDAANTLYGQVGPGVTTALFPLFAGMLRRALVLEDGEAADLEGDGVGPARKYPWEGEERQANDNGHTPSEVDSQESTEDNESPGTAASRLLEVSVSSLAEAYYAHQASKEFLEAAEQAGLMGSSSSPPPSLASSPTGHDQHEYGAHHPLDYVITQIDIARMVRNASRHLDVESILSLPTVTYRGKKKTKDADTTTGSDETDDGDSRQKKGGKEGEQLRHSAACATSAGKAESDDGIAWSWMMVPPNPEARSQEVSPSLCEQKVPPSSPEQARSSSLENSGHSDHIGNDDEHCVICLDHFVDGDRLRVLPCSHLFHAGCIDRWLSGAASDEECFTAGCPTCKERPYAALGSSHEGMPGAGVGTMGSGSSGGLRCGEEEGLLAQSRSGSGEGEAANSSLDGSVPRWAFARLGDAMAGRARTGASISEGA